MSTTTQVPAANPSAFTKLDGTPMASFDDLKAAMFEAVEVSRKKRGGEYFWAAELCLYAEKDSSGAMTIGWKSWTGDDWSKGNTLAECLDWSAQEKIRAKIARLDQERIATETKIAQLRKELHEGAA